jgi:uncharacterized membrane-anchored protein YitT (DUF2179 family)
LPCFSQLSTRNKRQTTGGCVWWVFSRAGIGFAIRGGGVLDGTEVLAIFISRKTGITIGDIILVVNILIFSSAVYFLDLETALYSMLTYYRHPELLIFYRGYRRISWGNDHFKKNEEIRKMIAEGSTWSNNIQRRRRFWKTRSVNQDMDIVFTVVTSLKYHR